MKLALQVYSVTDTAAVAVVGADFVKWCCFEYASTAQCVRFYSVASMQTRSSDENFVRPSVCLSVCQTRALWQNRRKICPDFNTIRKII